MIESVTTEDGNKIVKVTCDGTHNGTGDSAPVVYVTRPGGTRNVPIRNWHMTTVDGTVRATCPVCNQIRLANQFRRLKTAEEKSKRETEENRSILSCSTTQVYVSCESAVSYVVRATHWPTGEKVFLDVSGRTDEDKASARLLAEKELVEKVKALPGYTPPRLLEF